MKINHKIKMDLIRKGIPPRIHAVQDDSLCRVLQLELTADDYPWSIPGDAQVIVRYSKPDRTGGQYDTLPDGTRAWSARNNYLSVTLAPQVLTAPGTVELSVSMLLGNKRLTTFLILIDVEHHPAFSGTSENYSYITAFLPQPDSARSGQYLRISEVDQQGNILALEAVSSPGGLSQESKTSLLQLLRSAVYTEDVSEALAVLEESLDSSLEEVVPSGLTAVYSGGSVAAGTALGYFLGKVTVTRYYSDGTAAVLDATQHSISGAEIAAGTNILTVTDLETGLTATFTVIGTAVVYAVSITLLNDTTGTSTERSSASAESGSSYTATVTVPDGQELVSITVTMGGVDITASSVSGLNISIGAVTGDVAIIITVKESEATFYSVTKNLTNVTCDGASSVEENTAYAATVAANEGFELQSVTVTMGGVDVTASVYADGTVSIASVTGDIVITASAANSEEEVTMTDLSVVYSGGDVAIGTAVTELKGITVTAHYSDGSIQTVEKYAITGTIEEGSNTIAVSYNGFNAYFTVNGVETYPATCLVTNNMTNASTNNTLPGVAGGSYYTATITANDGYILEHVVVTMGGEDVTSSVYDASTGKITIETVTGNIVITAVANAVSYNLVNSWDFTNSLTDTVSGVTVDLAVGAQTALTQDEAGIQFTADNQVLQLTQTAQTLCNKRVEIDIASGQMETPATQHARLFAVATDLNVQTTGKCFVWRYNNTPGWTVYNGSWDTSLDTATYPVTFFDGKTVRLDFDEDCYLSLSYASIGSSDFTQICTFAKAIPATYSGYYVIGSQGSNQMKPLTISGVRIYEKEA